MASRDEVGWIDVSVPLHAGITVWPGDPELEIVRFASLAGADGANVTRFAMCAHTGTHLDAPLHFIDGADGVERAPLDVLIGSAKVVDAGERPCVDAELLERAGIGEGDRVLVRTVNSRSRWWTRPFREDFACLGEEAARYAAERKVRLLGVDGPSVGPPGEVGDRIHRLLLGAGLWLLEGLDLAAAPAGRWDLICLPLRLVGSDGAPARVVLRPVEQVLR